MGVCTPVEEHNAIRTGSFGMTDNDPHGIDPITGHDMVPNITAERADKTRDIVILYDCTPPAEATGCDVGPSVQNSVTVLGVEVVTTLEDKMDADQPETPTGCGPRKIKNSSTATAIESF